MLKGARKAEIAASPSMVRSWAGIRMVAMSVLGGMLSNVHWGGHSACHGCLAQAKWVRLLWQGPIKTPKAHTSAGKATTRVVVRMDSATSLKWWLRRGCEPRHGIVWDVFGLSTRQTGSKGWCIKG